MVNLRWFVAAATIATYFLVLGGMDMGAIHLQGLISRGVLDHARAVDVAKALIAVAAAIAVVPRSTA